MNIDIVIFEGFDEIDAVGPYEVFVNAAQGGADVEARLVTLAPAETVTGSHGLTVVPHGVLGDRPDLLVVPGGGWNDRSDAGAYAQVQLGDLPRAITARAAAGCVVATVCTGGMIGHAAGLFAGRPAITHHGAVQEFRAAGVEIVEARVVDDGDVLSCGGVTSGLDLALWIVEREFGKALADGVAREMEHDRVGPVWTRSG